MKQNELKKLMDTIDILKIITIKGAEEIAHFSVHLIIIGFYITSNVLLMLFFNYVLWIELIFAAGFSACLYYTRRNKIVLVSLFWLIAFSITLFLKLVLKNPIIIAVSLLITLIAAYFLSFLMIYNKTFKNRHFVVELKNSISLKVAAVCFIIPGGAGLFFALFYKMFTTSAIAGAFWGFILGICIFTAGIIAKGFYIIGLFGIFIIPTLYYLDNTIGISSYGILGLLIALYGILIQIKSKSESKFYE